MATVRVQEQDFDVAAEFAALTLGRTDIGGIGCFVGTVRDSAGGRRIGAMMLEHYPGMTERAMAAIADAAQARWELLGCSLVHRVGRLRPGENIVLVLAAAARPGWRRARRTSRQRNAGPEGCGLSGSFTRE